MTREAEADAILRLERMAALAKELEDEFADNAVARLNLESMLRNIDALREQLKPPKRRSRK